MPLQNVTYGTLINAIVNTINQSCINLSRSGYDNLPTSLKGGKFVNNTYGKKDYVSHITMTSSNGIPDRVGANVGNDIRNYVVPGTSAKISTVYPDGENISMPKFISFFNNIVSFCYGSMEFVSGYVNGVNASEGYIRETSYLTYKSSIDNTYKYDKAPDDLIRAKSVNEVLAVLRTELKSKLRSRSISYSWDLNN